MSDDRVIKGAARAGVRSSDVHAREELERSRTRRVAILGRPDVGVRLVVDVHQRPDRAPKIELRVLGPGRRKYEVTLHAPEWQAVERAIDVAREWMQGGEA